MSLYDWSVTETLPEDRPDPEVIENDARFDAWLEDMERKAKRRTAKARLTASQMASKE